MTRTIALRRRYYDSFTVGQLFIPEKEIILYTLELPYRNNQVNISCIPEGEYFTSTYRSQKHGYCIKIYQDDKKKEVNGRNGILIHKGNTIKDTQGCILVGTEEHYSLNITFKEGRIIEKGLGAILENSREGLEILLNYYRSNNNNTKDINLLICHDKGTNYYE